MNTNAAAAMAANIPQMGGGVPVRGRPQTQQLSQLIYSQIMTQNIPTSGWHNSVSPNMRVGNAMNIITNAFLAMPQADNPQIVSGGLQYERDAFSKCPDKASYDATIAERVNELFKKRQANEQNIHNSLNAQAAQNQSQMIMNQNMQMRGMGQPLQPGFQNIQQQMQQARMTQGQPTIGMTNVNGVPMNPNQQVMQMGAQMRPQLTMQTGMASLPPQDRVRVNQLAIAKFNAVPEPTRSQYRAAIQQKFGPHVVAQLQQDNMDPLVYYFQSQIIQNLTKNQNGVNQAGMQMQAHQQRTMNQPVQQLAAGPNGEFGPMANVESIMNQQKAGLMAQEAGQMVVPASNGAGRNPTPQPIGSMPGPNQGAGQPALPHQLPQQFNHQPAQQLKMDQRAAQTQAQIRAQAQAKQMQGQPGGLNGPGGASQSPAMNTLNAPVRRTPIGVGQTEGHPQMGQGNVPFAQMDPRFTQTGQRTPMGPNGNMSRNQLLHGILAQMPPEIRQQVLSQPQEKAAEMILRWNSTRAAAPMTGRPQPQIGHLGPGNPVAQSMNQFAQGGNGLGQHPNLSMPINQQNQFIMQQQMNKLRNPNAPQGPLDRNALMDNMAIPPKILESLRLSQGGVSPDVKKWGQLKQWMAQKNMAQQHVNNLIGIQNAQFQSYLKTNPALAAANLQLPQSNMPQQGMPPNGQATPQMGQPTPNVAGPNPNITVTPQELQSAKNHERFKGMSDEKLRQVLFTIKMQALKNRAAGQMSGPPAQAPQIQQTGHTTTAPSPSQPIHGAIAPQRQQNAGQEANAASPTVQGRNIKQIQNNRATPTVPTAPTAKTGTKRPHPDDAPEAPNPSGTPVSRPHSQQPQAGASSIPPQIPQASQEQLAAMSPEQRQKYEAMVKSRQAAPTSQMSEDMIRLRTIGQEQYQIEFKEQLPDIPMTPEQLRDTGHKIQALSGEMNKMSKLLARWYAFARDDGRAALYFKLRTRLIRQFVDAEKMSVLKDKFSITQPDLDSIRGLLESMGKDLTAHYPHSMRKNPSQQNAPEPAAPQGASTRPAVQPAPLNAANLEKQTQALNRMHQRNNSRAGQPPPPPTTAQPPFPFGAQSPDGQPTYAGKPAVTQDNLQLPARKKPKTEVKAGVGSSQSGPSANASPQGQKLSSPEMSKRQAAGDARSPKSQFRCTDQYCDFRGIGFLTAEALHKHTQEEHIKPAEDPIKFATDGLAELLGLDANGKPKTTATTGGNIQSPGDASKHIQTPPSKAESANSREVSMKRQGSLTGSKPNELLKTIAGRVGTPKPDTNSKPVDGATPVAAANGGAAAPQAAVGEPMGTTTIDPQELLSAVTSVEMGGNGAILDMNVYRSLTPNDTPESSKDSAASELNSDVSEGVALNVTLDMGFGTWEPFAQGHETPILDLESYNSMPVVQYPDLSWDDVNPDFDKPFTLDSSFFSLEAS